MLSASAVWSLLLLLLFSSEELLMVMNLLQVQVLLTSFTVCDANPVTFPMVGPFPLSFLYSLHVLTPFTD